MIVIWQTSYNRSWHVTALLFYNTIISYIMVQIIHFSADTLHFIFSYRYHFVHKHSTHSNFRVRILIVITFVIVDHVTRFSNHFLFVCLIDLCAIIVTLYLSKITLAPKFKRRSKFILFSQHICRPIHTHE